MGKTKSNIILIIITMLWVQTITGQNRAGKDTTICAGQQVIIGSPALPDECITWSDGGDNSSISNIYDAMPIVNPQKTTSYTVTIVGQNFSYKIIDIVTISVLGPSLTINPNKCCFTAGDDLKIEDFEFEANIENVDVVLEPSKVPVSVILSEYSENIEAKFYCAEDSAVGNALIKVVNDDITIFEVGTGTETPVGTALRIDKLLNKLENIKLPFKSCDEVETAANVGGSYSLSKVCCIDDGCVKKSHNINISGSVAAEINDCDIATLPIPYVTIPGISEIGLEVAAEAAANFQLSYKTSCDLAEACGTGNITASVTGKIEWELFSEALAQLELGLQGSVSGGNLEICVPPFLEPKFKFQTVCFGLDAVGKAEFFGSFFSFDVNYPIFKKCF